MTSRTVDLNGPVHYVDYSEQSAHEGSPLVLVHGLGGSHVNWDAVAPVLASKHRVLAVDLAGFGRTPLAGRSSKLEANAELLERFIDAVAGGPVTLIGNSMGGMLSMMVAAQSPERVRALVLVNAVHPPARGERLDREVALVFAMYMMPFVGEYVMRKRADKITAEQLVRETMRMTCAEPHKLAPEIIARHISIAEERRAMTWAFDAFLIATRSLVRSVLTPGKLARTADRVRAPTLVIHGDRDRLVPLGAARAAASRRGWDLEVLHGIGHIPQLETPERFVEVVERFVERQGSSFSSDRPSRRSPEFR